MTKKSQIQIAIDKIDAEIKALADARGRLYEAQQGTPLKRKPSPRRRDRAEGGTTDSGNMNYPPG